MDFRGIYIFTKVPDNEGMGTAPDQPPCHICNDQPGSHSESRGTWLPHCRRGTQDSGHKLRSARHWCLQTQVERILISYWSLIVSDRKACLLAVPDPPPVGKARSEMLKQSRNT